MNIERDGFTGRGAETGAKPQFALPVLNQVASRYSTTTFTAGTDFTIGAGAAATVVTIHMPYSGILGAYGRVGQFGYSSFAFGGAAATTFTTEVPYKTLDNSPAPDTTGQLTTNGYYMIDYETGTVYGRKADSGTTGTATYSYWAEAGTSSAPASLLGQVAASAETSTVYNGTTALTPKFAFANVAASQTDSAVVAAVTSKKIRVLQVYAVAGGTATNLTFNSKPGGAGTAISALLANAANGGEILPFSPVGWFETSSGQGLSVTTGAGATTGLGVVYVEV